MKKRNLTVKLALRKKIVAALDTKKLTGGGINANADDPLTHNSLCPIVTCSCSDPKFDNCKPVRV